MNMNIGIYGTGPHSKPLQTAKNLLVGGKLGSQGYTDCVAWRGTFLCR